MGREAGQTRLVYQDTGLMPQAISRPHSFDYLDAAEDGWVHIRYLETEQMMQVKQSAYLAGIQNRYRNWQLARETNLTRPPLCLSQFVGGASDNGLRS